MNIIRNAFKFIIGGVVVYFVGGLVLFTAYYYIQGEMYQPDKKPADQSAQLIKSEAKPKDAFNEHCDDGFSKSLAHQAMQQFIKKRIATPATASFPWRNQIKITVTRPCNFAIIGFFDAQNRYGANTRRFYEGTIIRDLQNTDSFSLKSLELAGE